MCKTDVKDALRAFRIETQRIEILLPTMLEKTL
jgi:hypothetical protein